MCRYDLPGVAPNDHSRQGEGHYMLGQKSLPWYTGEWWHCQGPTTLLSALGSP